jgi:3-oxoacyl-[acyl-carrier protein] reductase
MHMMAGVKWCADLADNEMLTSFINEARDADVLVNAAGVTQAELLVNLGDDEIMNMINVNVLAMVRICREVISSMFKKKSGCIVNISSVAAKRGNRGQSVYAGTKGFVESFTRSLAAEYGSRGVRVNCVSPGPIGSGGTTELMGYASDKIRESVSMRRHGYPDDVASAVRFLCSDDASFINGRCIDVDGGFQSGV